MVAVYRVVGSGKSILLPGPAFLSNLDFFFLLSLALLPLIVNKLCSYTGTPFQLKLDAPVGFFPWPKAILSD